MAYSNGQLGLRTGGEKDIDDISSLEDGGQLKRCSQKRKLKNAIFSESEREQGLRWIYFNANLFN